jgi:hypothetical protein
MGGTIRLAGLPQSDKMILTGSAFKKPLENENEQFWLPSLS